MTTVIKLGGRVQCDPSLGTLLATQWRAHPRAMCVVHGGGDEVTSLQNAMGIKPTFVNGRRVTAPEDIDLVRMALSGAANKRLVHTLVHSGIPAVGISGEDAALFAATPIDNGALGAVGEVQRVNTDLIKTLWNGGYLPVISPLASPALNVNGDEAAAALAVALHAQELVLISDVPAVHLGRAGTGGSFAGSARSLPRPYDGVVVATIDEAQVREAIASGEISGGMVVKVQAALSAIAGGVQRVRIGDLGLLNGTNAGTTVHHSQHVAVAL